MTTLFMSWKCKHAECSPCMISTLYACSYEERVNGLTNYKDSVDVSKIKTKHGTSSC